MSIETTRDPRDALVRDKYFSLHPKPLQRWLWQQGLPQAAERVFWLHWEEGMKRGDWCSELSLREVALRFATPKSQFVGTPAQVADRLQLWFERRGADGFNLFESLPGQLEAFVEGVIPELQKRGLFRTDYEGETLRDNLGLDFPINRYTAARAAISAA